MIRVRSYDLDVLERWVVRRVVDLGLGLDSHMRHLDVHVPNLDALRVRDLDDGVRPLTDDLGQVVRCPLQGDAVPLDEQRPLRPVLGGTEDDRRTLRGVGDLLDQELPGLPFGVPLLPKLPHPFHEGREDEGDGEKLQDGADVHVGSPLGYHTR